MRAQWIGALVGAVVALAIIAIAAGIFFYITKAAPPGAHATAAATSGVSPATLQNMTLEAQFKGPLKDTVIQRWTDSDTGVTCYIYLPVVVQHSAPTPTGYVQYGANGIGSISCAGAH
jgi:hypothetical protein